VSRKSWEELPPRLRLDYLFAAFHSMEQAWGAIARLPHRLHVAAIERLQATDPDSLRPDQTSSEWAMTFRSIGFNMLSEINEEIARELEKE